MSVQIVEHKKKTERITAAEEELLDKIIKKKMEKERNNIIMYIKKFNKEKDR